MLFSCKKRITKGGAWPSSPSARTFSTQSDSPGQGNSALSMSSLPPCYTSLKNNSVYRSSVGRFGSHLRLPFLCASNFFLLVNALHPITLPSDCSSQKRMMYSIPWCTPIYFSKLMKFGRSQYNSDPTLIWTVHP